MKFIRPIEVRIYLGHGIPTGGVVSHADMQEFCHDYVDVRFDGYTVGQGEGVWCGEREDVTVLEFIIEATEYAKCKDIAKLYKTFFYQEAVLITHKSLESGELV